MKFVSLFFLQELKLGVLGGKNLASTGKSILSNLLTPKLAYQYNWTGQKGKMEFQAFENINRTIWGKYLFLIFSLLL